MNMITFVLLQIIHTSNKGHKRTDNMTLGEKTCCKPTHPYSLISKKKILRTVIGCSDIY